MNAIYGVEAWNFGSRTIKGRKGYRTLDKTASQVKTEAAATPAAADAAAAADADGIIAVDDYDPAVDLREAAAPPVKRVPSKKAGGVRKGGSKAMSKKLGVVQICRDCQQVSHEPITILENTRKVEAMPAGNHDESLCMLTAAAILHY